MSRNSQDRQTLQREALKGLQPRWGTDRKSEVSEEHHSRMRPFLEFPNGQDSHGFPAFLDPSAEQMEEFSSAMRTLRRAAETHPFENQGDGPPRELVREDQRRELLAEITSDHFRRNIGTWMSSTPLEHYAASTPVDELETLLAESSYRLKLMTAAVRMMTREVSALERQISLKRELAATPENR